MARRFGGALVAAHDLELGAGIGVERHGIEHRGRAAARCADGKFLLAHVLERFDPGRRQRHAGIDIGGDAADIMEIRGVHLGRAADRAVERQGLRQAAEHGPVLRRHLRQYFAATKLPAPGMFSGRIAGLPGRWRGRNSATKRA